MKTLKLLMIGLLTFISFSFGTMSCSKDSTASENLNNSFNTGNELPTGKKIKITIGTTVFNATLYDNATVLQGNHWI